MQIKRETVLPLTGITLRAPETQHKSGPKDHEREGVSNRLPMLPPLFPFIPVQPATPHAPDRPMSLLIERPASTHVDPPTNQ